MASWVGQVSTFLKEQWAWEAFLVGEQERCSKNRSGNREQEE